MRGGALRGAAAVRRFLVAVLCAASITGCADFRVTAARNEADRIALPAGFVPEVVDADLFRFTSYVRNRKTTDNTLVVYIEGDGLAWINRGRVSGNPTPPDPLALRLAAADNAPTVLYLARPCQFAIETEAASCASRYWTTARFAPEVVDAENRAIDEIKGATSKNTIELIGYSGGGTLATLLAARRSDVERVITVAANLDLPSWTDYHDVTPLKDSLNPSDFVERLRKIPQVIFVGGEDENVPLSVVTPYARRFTKDSVISLIVIPTYSHSCCWARQWPDLLLRARAAETRRI